MTQRLLHNLDLEYAAAAVASERQNLLPPQPSWSLATNYPRILAKLTRARLGKGMVVHASVEIAARKSGHGLRPLPFVGVPEQVVYSALTNFLTNGAPAPGRSPEDWVKFSRAPVDYGASLGPQPPDIPDPFHDLPSLSPIKYVVRSDVVAFYRYVNHEQLHDELITQGADYEGAQHLRDFLGELQGAAIGLPQLLHSSDVLSEIYIDAVERDMLRKGHNIWRFNDDFRIACRGYVAALEAIEHLDACMRKVGLTLNEPKTTTPTFSSYYNDVSGLTVSGIGPIVSNQEVEDLVGDYADQDTQDAEAAASLLDRLTEDPTRDTDIDLHTTAPPDVRLIKRAIASLALAKDQRALAKIPKIVRYLSELTPTAIKYVLALGTARVAKTRLGNALDEMAQRMATNSWQRIWIIHGYVGAHIFDLKTNRDQRVEWLRQSLTASETPLRAQAVWALALCREITLDEVVRELETAPECVHLYYAEAARVLGTPQNQANRRKVFAHDLLLKEIASSDAQRG